MCLGYTWEISGYRATLDKFQKLFPIDLNMPWYGGLPLSSHCQKMLPETLLNLAGDESLK